MLIVLTGGARSGKSRLAVERALRTGRNDVVFIATCPPIVGDAELERRIQAHRGERRPTWATIEAEHELAAAIGRAEDRALVIVDCLTLWVANLLYRGDDEDDVVLASREALAVVAGRSGETVVVTNEVGLGIVPALAVSRTYRDVLGRVNQEWVAAADRALLLVAGRALALDDPDDLLP